MMKKKIVYFLACNAEIKIGYTEKWWSRRRDYEAKFGLVECLGIIPGDRRKEREMHKRFATHHLHGEWFEDTPAVRHLVCRVLTERHEPPPEKDHRWFGRMLESIFPDEPVQQLHAITGHSKRSCRHYIAGITEPRASVGRDLICSEHGPEILREIMKDSTAPWWVEFKPFLDASSPMAVKRDWIFCSSECERA